MKIFKKFIKNKIYSLNGKNFCFFYNLIQKLLYKNNYITYDGQKYILNESNIRWSFSYKSRSLNYLNGIKKRGKDLHKIYLLENIRFDKNDIVIDIGAHNGDFFLGFDQEVKYYGYEPSPVIFLNLKDNIKNQNIYNLALSNLPNDRIDFYLSDKNADSSALLINEYTKKIKVQTTTLDEEIKKIQNKIKLIKIEAEGFEPEILEGLSKYINHIEYITVDCGFERGVAKESTLKECSNYLIKNNFKMINFSSRRVVALFKNLDN